MIIMIMITIFINGEMVEKASYFFVKNIITIIDIITIIINGETAKKMLFWRELVQTSSLHSRIHKVHHLQLK